MKTNDKLEPIVFVIFGGAGDLTWRKLVPAAVDRVDLIDEKLRRRLHDGVKKFSRKGVVKTGEWREFASHIHYQQGDFKNLQTYTALGEQCAMLEKEWGAKVHRIFYMATPPSMFGEIPGYLGKRVTTVFVRQGHYALDPKILTTYPAADVSIERIGDLLDHDLAYFTPRTAKGAPDSAIS